MKHMKNMTNKKHENTLHIKKGKPLQIQTLQIKVITRKKTQKTSKTITNKNISLY